MLGLPAILVLDESYPASHSFLKERFLYVLCWWQCIQSEEWYVNGVSSYPFYMKRGIQIMSTVTLSLSARILKMWFTDPFRHIWIFSVHPNYTPVKFLHISYFNLVMTFVWSVMDGALNLFLCYLVLAVTPSVVRIVDT